MDIIEVKLHYNLSNQKVLSQSTPNLLKYYKILCQRSRRRGWDDFDMDNLLNSIRVIKMELDTREHIVKKRKKRCRR